MNAVLQIARLAVILALLCVAAAIATPKGRLPLALRGLAKLLKNDGVRTVEHPEHPNIRVPLARRFLAFFLVLLAILLALI